MTKATYDGCYASDQLARYVKYAGRDALVIGVNFERDDYEGQVVISDADGQQVITVDLIECVPLCSHCLTPLCKSNYTAPGACNNLECFLYDPEPCQAQPRGGSK